MDTTKEWGANNPNSEKDVGSIQATNPSAQKTMHPQLGNEQDVRKESGKDIGLVNAPIQSIHPTSAAKADSKPQEYDVFDDANRYLNHDKQVYDFAYPFKDMDVGQGFFVPVEANMTTDQLIANLHRDIFTFVQQTSECEKDEKGDDVWESIVIQTKKRTDDGVIQLDGLGKPIVGANQTNRPKLIHSANFMVRAVVKDDELIEGGRKADSDGALVIRVA